jgi:hypothetical protein
LNRVRTATKRENGESQSREYATSPHRTNFHPPRLLT